MKDKLQVQELSTDIKNTLEFAEWHKLKAATVNLILIQVRIIINLCMNIK